MKTVEGVAFRKSQNRKFCKVHQMTPNQIQSMGHEKYLRYMYVHCSTLSPKFSSASLYDRDIPHLTFPIDSHVKISKCHKIFNYWQIAKISINYIPYDCLIYHKVWLRLDKNYRSSSVLKFPAPYGSASPKISKCPKMFNFWQIAKISIALHSPMTTLFVI